MTGEVGQKGEIQAAFIRTCLAIFLSMNVMMFSMVLWTQNLETEASQEHALAPIFWSLFRVICLVFTTPVLFLLLGPLARDAFDRARQGILGSDLLLTLGVLAAYLYSCVSVVRDSGDVYFEVSCIVLIAVTLGRWLEARGRFRATEAIQQLEKLLPEHAVVVRKGEEYLVPTKDVAIGEVLRVRPGGTIPLDGRLLSPSCEVDERILSGESLPRDKVAGDQVLAGSIVLLAEIELRVETLYDSTMVHRMAEVVRQACLRKGYYQNLADRVSAWFFPAVSILAIMTFLVHGTLEGFSTGLMQGLAVLVAACPCALGLATPMVIWAAVGNAASQGVLFRSGDGLERLARVRAGRFDKTGTLTCGHRLIGHEFGSEEPHWLPIAIQLARRSTHPVSAAIASQACTAEIPSSLVAVVEEPGAGVRATLSASGSSVQLASERRLRLQGCTWSSKLLRERFHSSVAAGEVVTCFAHNDSILGFFRLEEELRRDASTAISDMQSLGLDVGILTGDHAERARWLATRLRTSVLADLSPDDKVRELERVALRIGPVVMVGEGVNDAPALAAADVGVAMGCGADVSRMVADVCLTGDSLDKLAPAIRLARFAVQVIRQNLFWAFFYNVMVVGFAVAGALNPVQASLAMVASSAIVSTNSLRVRRQDLFAEIGVEAGENRPTRPRPPSESRSLATSSHMDVLSGQRDPSRHGSIQSFDSETV